MKKDFRIVGRDNGRTVIEHADGRREYVADDTAPESAAETINRLSVRVSELQAANDQLARERDALQAEVAALKALKALPALPYTIEGVNKDAIGLLVGAGYETLESLKGVSQAELEAINGIGAKTAERILAGLPKDE